MRREQFTFSPRQGAALGMEVHGATSKLSAGDFPC